MEENKFNFSEEEEQKAKAADKAQEAEKTQAVEETKEAVKKDAKGLIGSVRSFFVQLLGFAHDTDRDATIEAIKGDIPFKGATAWILICSIFVASIGLNANSTAVVIGAMLISPLMGPILGIGLSLAINDIDTLKRSLINLATMIVLSLLTAFLFFYFFPLSEDTSELLGRVKPDIRDVLIAFFGGLALIIARTKKGTIASVIFGVAIATALMPPLCTVGYGLAVAAEGDLSKGIEFAKGAIYLFTINTIFIALATFLVLKLLRFPMLKYANSAKRKRIARLASLIAIVVMIPAVMTFFSVLKESNFKKDARAFIDNELDGLPHADYIKKNVIYKYSPEKGSSIALNSFGLDEIPQSTIDILKSRMKAKAYRAINEATLIVDQKKNKSLDNFKYMEELRYRDSLDLLSQNQKIQFLEERVQRLAKYERDEIPFENITAEVKINYENLEQISYSNVISSNFQKIDTLTVFSAKWKTDNAITEEIKEKEKQKLEQWLKLKLKLKKLEVKRIN